MIRYSRLGLNLILLSIICLSFSCKKKKVEFSNWSKESLLEKEFKGENKVTYKTFYSKTLEIDTIYRSMQGPYEIKSISINENEEDIVWITSYESKLVNSSNEEYAEDRFMCHNNFNYRDTSNIPWKLKTSGGNSRIFTLSEGQTKLIFPKGFGIPVRANQNFEMVSQVLNHLETDIDLTLKHEVKIGFIKESDRKTKITPLYQQSIFVTKQVAGPKGKYGLPKLCISHHLDSNALDGEHPNHDCSTTFKSEKHNPYEDSEGRKYTGHWNITFGEESLQTDVTPMLDLSENTRIHFIGVHLHPFATALELWDITIDSLLYSSAIIPQSNFGFKEIGFYSSKEGIPVFASHQYELRSTYNNTDSLENQTAMAVMYLYLEDK